jgi:hypothetical protein
LFLLLAFGDVLEDSAFSASVATRTDILQLSIDVFGSAASGKCHVHSNAFGLMIFDSSF